MPFGEIVSSTAGGQLVGDMISESVKVGRRVGARFEEDTAQRSVAFLDSYGPQLRSSMVRDIERRWRLQVDSLNGHVVNQAAWVSVDVPPNRMLWTLVSLHNQRLGA